MDMGLPVGSRTLNSAEERNAKTAETIFQFRVVEDLLIYGSRVCSLNVL